MELITVKPGDSGQRLDKYLGKYLREAPKSFLYKMMRKKNITLNGKKAQGNEILKDNDEIKLFLADETIEKFRGSRKAQGVHGILDIPYEDDQVLFVNKPAGMLSQKASREDVSLVEYIAGYLQEKEGEERGDTFRPGICNRLDRYYSKTVFEFVSTSIGAQGTVLGGGRYDTLIENLGGPSVPAVGFGSGIERMLLVLENTGKAIPQEAPLGVYAAGLDEAGRRAAFLLVQQLRKAGVSADFDHAARSVKAQFKYAGKVGARFVVAIGSNELESGMYTIKDMAASASESVAAADAAAYLASKLQ